MKNIKTQRELELVISALTEAYEYSEIIPDKYQLVFNVTEFTDAFATVSYSWFSGIQKAPFVSHDPQIQPDDVLYTKDNYFILSRKVTMQKLTQEVFSSIDYVLSKEFNEDVQLTND